MTKTFTMDMYPIEAMEIAESRGWNREQHESDLESGNEMEFSLSHPINWLTEEEAEVYF